MKNYFWLIALLFSTAVFQSCEKEPITEEPLEVVAPELPPLAMFVMPVEEFDETEVDTSQSANRTLTYQNWFHAAVNLVVWHTIVEVNMAIPTAAFGAAFNVTPEYIGDLTFEWAYQYVAPQNLGGHTYFVSLTGQYQNNFEQVEWIMTVSQSGGFSDFVWYSGVVSTIQPEGEFVLYRFPNNPQPYLRLNFVGDDATGEGILRFTNVIPGHPDFGQYIEYRESPSSEFDRAFDVQGAPDNFLQIQWNEFTGEGRVNHPFHFNDEDWHCWDVTYIDVECE